MPRKSTVIATAIVPAVLVLSMAEIHSLSAKEQCARFAERATVSQKAFAEMGKLHHSIVGSLRQGQTIYGELRKLGVKDSTISNASYASRVWNDLVAAGHLTEADFDGFTFADCLAICRATGGKSQRQLAAEEVSLLIREKPESFDAELASIYETGLTIEEAEAQAKAAAEAKAAAIAESERQTQAGMQAKAEEAARRKLEEEQRAAATPPAPAAGTPAPAPVAESHTPAAPVVVEQSTPPAPVPMASAPAPAPAAEPTAPSNIHQMPGTVDPDSALPEWKAAVDQLFADFGAFSESAKEEAHAYLVAALTATVEREAVAA